MLSRTFQTSRYTCIWPHLPWPPPCPQVNSDKLGYITFDQLAAAYVAERGAGRGRLSELQPVLGSNMLHQHTAATGGGPAATRGGPASVRSRASRMTAASRPQQRSSRSSNKK